jgi:hypothetical protein
LFFTFRVLVVINQILASVFLLVLFEDPWCLQRGA